MRKKAAISFIHNFGQMPKQLFKRPHRQRKVLARAVQANQPIDMVGLAGTYTLPVFFKNIVQLMPSREPVKGIIFLGKQCCPFQTLVVKLFMKPVPKSYLYMYLHVYDTKSYEM